MRGASIAFRMLSAASYTPRPWRSMRSGGVWQQQGERSARRFAGIHAAREALVRCFELSRHSDSRLSPPLPPPHHRRPRPLSPLRRPRPRRQPAVHPAPRAQPAVGTAHDGSFARCAALGPTPSATPRSIALWHRAWCRPRRRMSLDAQPSRYGLGFQLLETSQQRVNRFRHFERSMTPFIAHRMLAIRPR